MGRASRTQRERQSRAINYPPPEHVDDRPWVSPGITWDGKVHRFDSEVSAEDVDAFIDDYFQAKESESEKGESKMSWFNWLKPKPTYFDTVTSLVEQTVDLECLLKEDKEACYERIKEIEAAERELKVRVFRG
jgi:hypothetical protein